MPDQAAPRRTVLVVDDEPMILRSTRLVLEAAGFLVATAQGGEQAVEIASRDPPDVVLLDLMMPDVDGWQVLRRLRAAEATRDVPVVIVTSRVITPEERDSLEGTFAIVSKQELSRATLAPIVQAATGRDDGRQQRPAAPLPL